MRSPMQAKLVTKNLVCMFECDENVRAIHAMRILFVLRSRGLLNTFSVDVSNRGVAGIALLQNSNWKIKVSKKSRKTFCCSTLQFEID